MPHEPSAAAEAIAGDATGTLYQRCIADMRRLYRLYRGPLEREGKWETTTDVRDTDETLRPPPRHRCDTGRP